MRVGWVRQEAQPPPQPHTSALLSPPPHYPYPKDTSPHAGALTVYALACLRARKHNPSPRSQGHQTTAAPVHRHASTISRTTHMPDNTNLQSCTPPAPA